MSVVLSTAVLKVNMAWSECIELRIYIYDYRLKLPLVDKLNIKYFKTLSFPLLFRLVKDSVT